MHGVPAGAREQTDRDHRDRRLGGHDQGEEPGAAEQRQRRGLEGEHPGAAQGPAYLVRRARAEAAADLLESTALSVTEVAARCGFGSAETLRQVFVDFYAIPPSRFRAVHRRL
ncbi:helix-turn-helix domain-containing protein [Nocardiopsis sp. L17-MgMaSL7]|uniref:helix-turn-helix domain-containing protein n=1 Tax=Nocardiopsis sp. L17-MgMaSL7 TaxID=1938893 RepID=UPI001F407A65|nr:helix-turn-helix domain-containing protein [Nocardiopsis sp. L17-MgMaSL7]